MTGGEIRASSSNSTADFRREEIGWKSANLLTHCRRIFSKNFDDFSLLRLKNLTRDLWVRGRCRTKEPASGEASDLKMRPPPQTEDSSRTGTGRCCPPSTSRPSSELALVGVARNLIESRCWSDTLATGTLTNRRSILFFELFLRARFETRLWWLGREVRFPTTTGWQSRDSGTVRPRRFFAKLKFQI